jgi:glucose/arabinose dehydrogenase
VSKAARFTQADVTRAVKGMEIAGLRVTGVRIDPNGAIVVSTDHGSPAGSRNPLDRLLLNGS